MSNLTFPEKLQPIFKPRRYKIMHGGRGGGKSWSIALYFIIMGTQRPIRVLCCREFQKSIKDSVYTLLYDTIKRLELESFYTVLHNEIRGANGTQFNFEGLSQNVVGIKSYEGVDFVWVEEGHSVTKKSWDILIPTIRKEGSEIWVSFNPELEDDYAYERWVVGEDPMATVLEVNWRDNPWFPPVLNEERIAHKLRDPDSYDHVWEGKPRQWLEGAIYARQLRKAFEEERIGIVPFDPDVRVFTAWDIGRTDDTAIWWYQRVGREIHQIDFISESGGDPSHFASVVLGVRVQIDIVDNSVVVSPYIDGVKVEGGDISKADRYIDDSGVDHSHRKEYQYQTHWLPHDAKGRKFEAHGKSAKDQLQEALGWDAVRISRKLSLEDGIQAVRTLFPNMWFDRERCADGIKALRSYKRESQVDDKSLKPNPVHNWASHGSDALRTEAEAFEDSVAEAVEDKPLRYDDYGADIEEGEFNWKVAL